MKLEFKEWLKFFHVALMMKLELGSNNEICLVWFLHMLKYCTIQKIILIQQFISIQQSS